MNVSLSTVGEDRVVSDHDDRCAIGMNLFKQIQHLMRHRRVEVSGGLARWQTVRDSAAVHRHYQTGLNQDYKLKLWKMKPIF